MLTVILLNTLPIVTSVFLGAYMGLAVPRALIMVATVCQVTGLMVLVYASRFCVVRYGYTRMQSAMIQWALLAAFVYFYLFLDRRTYEVNPTWPSTLPYRVMSFHRSLAAEIVWFYEAITYVFH